MNIFFHGGLGPSGMSGRNECYIQNSGMPTVEWLVSVFPVALIYGWAGPVSFSILLQRT